MNQHKPFSKGLSLALCLALLLTLLPVTARAEEDSWDGSIATAFDGGDGTVSTPTKSPSARSWPIWRSR